MKIYLRFGSAILCLALAASLPAVAQDSWADRLKGAIPETPTTPRPLEGAAGPTLGAEHEQLVAGLKEALETGSRRAIEAAGESGGFEDNPDIRIPMPGPLATASGMLRGVGLGRQVDEFEESMNRAAEKAVPEARDIIIEAIRDMSIDDARAILVGPEDGATRFLRRQAGDRMAARFRPIVAESMEETGVTRAFTGLTEQVGTRLPGISAVDELDLNEYVTNETLDGVFTLLAQEEKKIRQDPAARTTELLREVFGN